jgi:predicted SAM-dependent methyltransferase
MKYVQFGGFTDCPEGWLNFETSMHLRLSRLPILGHIFKKLTPHKFSDKILIGDIVKGLPVDPGSVDVVFSSHVIEHLSREDALTAFQNVHMILKPGGLFRFIVPDLLSRCKHYVDHYDEIEDPAGWLMRSTHLGMEHKQAMRITDRLRSFFSTSAHKWMWDERSLTDVLDKAGFQNIRRSTYTATSDRMLSRAQKKERFFWTPGFTIDGANDSLIPELVIEATRATQK